MGTQLSSVKNLYFGIPRPNNCGVRKKKQSARCASGDAYEAKCYETETATRTICQHSANYCITHTDTLARKQASRHTHTHTHTHTHAHTRIRVRHERAHWHVLSDVHTLTVHPGAHTQTNSLANKQSDTHTHTHTHTRTYTLTCTARACTLAPGLPVPNFVRFRCTSYGTDGASSSGAMGRYLMVLCILRREVPKLKLLPNARKN